MIESQPSAPPPNDNVASRNGKALLGRRKAAEKKRIQSLIDREKSAKH